MQLRLDFDSFVIADPSTSTDPVGLLVRGAYSKDDGGGSDEEPVY